MWKAERREDIKVRGGKKINKHKANRESKLSLGDPSLSKVLEATQTTWITEDANPLRYFLSLPILLCAQPTMALCLSYGWGSIRMWGSSI